MIGSDDTVSIVQHQRRITFIPGTGKIINAKKGRGLKAFQVTHLVIKWYDDQEPGPVVAHGFYNHPTHGIVHTERSFVLNGKKTPTWLKEAVNGTSE